MSRLALSVGGMHPMEALSLYNGDGYDDPDVVAMKKRAYDKAWRLKNGVVPFDGESPAAHTPPCKGCAFAQRCKEKELACNIFAEWSVSRRPIPDGIKKLLPSKRWMKLLSETEHLRPVRKAYYEVIERQTGQAAPKTDDLFLT